EAASKAGTKYNDVVFRFAVDYVRTNPSIEPDFTVTPEMERTFFDSLIVEGVEVTWEQFQEASRLVDRQLAVEISRAKWGQEGMAQRLNRDDNVIRTAMDLLRAAPDQQTLFSATAGGGRP